MPKKNPYKYRLKPFILVVIITCILFFSLAGLFFTIFGLFQDDSLSEKLVFIHPEYAWGMFSIAVLFAVFVRHILRRNKLIIGGRTQEIISSYLHPVSTKRLFFKYFLIQAFLFFIILALMEPAFGSKEIKAKTNGVELVVAVDVSNSMNTKDTRSKEPRLKVAKRVINQLIDRGNIARIALVVFAGDAFPQLPLTPNRNAAKMYTNQLSSKMVSTQGTNISAALQTAASLYSDKENNKVLLLITDGEDHEGDLKEGIKAIKNKNVSVLIMGLGSLNGGLVPGNSNSGEKWMRDQNGKIVISKLNRQMLHQIAQKLGATLLISDQPFPNISKFLTQINNQSEGKIVNLKFKIKKNRYQIPLGLALLSLLTLFVIGISEPNKKKNE